MKIFQKGFNYSQDGPGNRLVYHLQGCNFYCPWCANPEGMQINKTAKDYSKEQIIDEVTRSKPIFFDGGGVTFTGGEVTLQFDELKEILSLLKSSGINTCIETNGSHKRLFELLPFVDNLIMDIKHYDSKEHYKWTQNDGVQTFKNLKYICDNRIPALIRIPFINKVNTNETEFCKFLMSFAPNVQRFEILKYHEYGKDKWETQYKIVDGFVTESQYQSFIKTLKENGLTVVNT